MGFSHRSTAPPTTGQVAHALPHATDSLVQDAAYLGLAYERLRGAFLALSGVSLLRTLALAEQADLAGVIAIARLALDEAREHVVHVRDSASPATRIRGRRAAVAIEALAAEAARAAKDGFSEIDVRVLRAVRGALAATSLPEAPVVSAGRCWD